MNHEDNNSDVSMVHLNGIAGFYFSEKKRAILNQFQNKSLNCVDPILNMLKDDSENRYSLMNFAWEEDTASAFILRRKIELAQKISAETDILVVIGYSFPFFNREVDKKIFDSLKLSGKLKKIFFQDPYRSGEFLRNQFDLHESVEIKNVTATENYFVPNEL